jgi:single-strand DNA-binding protein
MPDTTTTIVGNLTEDPTVHFTTSGAPVSNFTVAVTARIKNDDGWKDGETSFYRCTVWRSLAENLADSLSKGDRVIVYGRLQQRSWETPEGDKRSVVEVQAEDVGPSLKWATATAKRGNREGEPLVKAGQFNDPPPL